MEEAAAAMASPREGVAFRARMAQRLGRHDDMFLAVNHLAENYQDLTTEEIGLFYTAYRKKFHNKFCELKTIKSIQLEDQYGNHNVEINRYWKILSSEMKVQSEEGIKVLEHLLHGCAVEQQCLLLHKMYWSLLLQDGRFILVSVHGASREAIKKSKDLSPAHPQKLALVLNLSAILCDEMKKSDRAMVLAQQTVNDAIPLLRSLDEESFRASTAILDAMKNNISMWIEDKNRDKENYTAEKEKSSKSTADEKESGNSVPYTTPYSTRPPSPVIRRAVPPANDAAFTTLSEWGYQTHQGLSAADIIEEKGCSSQERILG
ncbi:hypothetical protein ACP70R_031902 [Stipagrostis hirtigluma subsp. patula]